MLKPASGTAVCNLQRPPHLQRTSPCRSRCRAQLCKAFRGRAQCKAKCPTQPAPIPGTEFCSAVHTSITTLLITLTIMIIIIPSVLSLLQLLSTLPIAFICRICCALPWPRQIALYRNGVPHTMGPKAEAPHGLENSESRRIAVTLEKAVSPFS